MHDAGVALGDLGLAIDDEAGLLVMLVPEVHLRAGLDGRLRQREAEAVVAYEQPLRAPVLTTHVGLRALDVCQGANDHSASSLLS